MWSLLTIRPLSSGITAKDKLHKIRPHYVQLRYSHKGLRLEHWHTIGPTVEKQNVRYGMLPSNILLIDINTNNNTKGLVMIFDSTTENVYIRE